mmetsp:Transcript_17428/g.31455  ORF Transcript_17428/g.31455 Transcript_17428/m.31455 type:complete len:179 (+) Transcript_17428:59-595(+)
MIASIDADQVIEFINELGKKYSSEETLKEGVLAVVAKGLRSRSYLCVSEVQADFNMLIESRRASILDCALVEADMHQFAENNTSKSIRYTDSLADFTDLSRALAEESRKSQVNLQELGSSIRRLPASELKEIIFIVRDFSQGLDETEFEFDLDKLSQEKLIELKTFVDNALNRAISNT